MDHGSSLEVVAMCKVALLLVGEGKRRLQQFHRWTWIEHMNNIKQVSNNLHKIRGGVKGRNARARWFWFWDNAFTDPHYTHKLASPVTIFKYFTHCSIFSEIKGALLSFLLILYSLITVTLFSLLVIAVNKSNMHTESISLYQTWSSKWHIFMRNTQNVTPCNLIQSCRNLLCPEYEGTKFLHNISTLLPE